MRRPLLAFALTACLGPARAGDTAPVERYVPPFEVVIEAGVDIPAASKVLKLFRKLSADYPSLVNARIVKKVVFVSPDRGLGNVKYCWNPDGIVVGDGDSCAAEHLAVVIDLDTMLSFETTFGDFYQKGREVEAVVFHELLHGWAYTNPARLEEYGTKISDGRRTRFERKKNRLFKPLWAIERRMAAAAERIEMGDDSKDAFVAKGDGEFDQAIRIDRWERYHDRMSLELARSALAADEKKLGELGPRIGLKVEKYNKRRDVPRRGERDIHAIENEQEWFAYGGEIANYAAAPQDFLTAEELAWWRDIDGELRGGSRRSGR